MWLARRQGIGACFGAHRGPREPRVPPRRLLPNSSTATTSPSLPTTRTSCLSPAAVASWPLERRASLLVVSPVFDFDPADLAAARSAGVGGVILLGGATAPSDLAALIGSSLHGGANPDPLVMADEEGGGVQRLSGVVANLPWARSMAATMSAAQVQVLATSLGSEMRSLGVNVDLAPVLDVDGRPGPSSTNPDGLRSFSADPAEAADYGVAFMNGLQAGGILSVVKHFPGLGGSSGNTDYSAAATLPWSELETSGLTPFRAAITAGARAVMVANAYVPGLTGQPASVSSTVITGVLRNELGFHGLVMTDSLSAGAMADAGLSIPAAAVATIAAGADMVLFGATLDPEQTAQLAGQAVAHSISLVVGAITAAVVSGSIPVSRLDDAVVHVLQANGTATCS